MSIQENINRVLATTTIGAGARASYKAKEEAKAAKKEEREYQEERDAVRHKYRMQEIQSQGEEQRKVAETQAAQKIAIEKEKGEQAQKVQGIKERAATRRTKLKTQADIEKAKSDLGIAQARARKANKAEREKTKRMLARKGGVVNEK